MASNPVAAVRSIRRAREAEPPEDSLGRFPDYRDVYQDILSDTLDVCGETAFDDLTEWVIRKTHEHQEVPEPDDVREKARELCRESGVEPVEDLFSDG